MMKIRNGFVSNSSSTAFIIDLRNDGAKEYINQAKKHLHGYLNYGRTSCVATAEDMREYLGSDDVWYDDMIKTALIFLGDNAVFVRISDEEVGGWFHSPYKEIIYSEQEWH